MDLEREFGRANANAPTELSRFAFLIGNWQCEARLLLPGGERQVFPASWSGRYILDGYAIADEYRMTGSSGELIVYGLNFRSYEVGKRLWHIRWLNALAGNWVELASPELGGVRVSGRSVIYTFQEPVAGHTYTRATYTSVSSDRFTWLGEKSEDRTAWSEFMIVEARRSQ